MSLVLHDLAAGDGRLFSPNCWRTRLALLHKGLSFETRPTLFTGIPAIGPGVKTVPVLADAGTLVIDSFVIAEHLEARYPDRPSLFGGDTGRRLAWFIQQWVVTATVLPVLKMIVADIHARLAPQDQPYFRESREKRFKGPLEAVQAKARQDVEAFRAGLAPLRLTFATQPFLGGEAPTYADYVAFGTFQWARMMSPFRVLAEDDPVLAWVRRCIDLHGGAARAVTAEWA